jgi:hypothetical protein
VTLLGGDARGKPRRRADRPAGPAALRPKAKRVIYLMQSGAPSHVDLFDCKPEFAKRRG